MEKIVQKALLCCLFLCSFSISAQTTEKEYLEAENSRIVNAQAIDVEIENFISANISEYALSQDDIDLVIKKLAEEGITSKEEIQNALNDLKESKLRELYFENNPDAANFYKATPVPVNLAETCLNGDFESNPAAAGYSFVSNPTAGTAQCAVLRPVTGLVPAVNNFNSNVTLINSTPFTFPAYVQFDPTLNSNEFSHIHVPTLSPNGGRKCIKLNDKLQPANPGPRGGNDVTSMTKNIFIDNSRFDYELSLILQASGHLASFEEPIFTVRFYDLQNNLLQQRCIISQPNCVFHEAPSTDLQDSSTIYYTDWICDAIDVSALVGLPADQTTGFNAKVEFIVTDCGQGLHFGTAYIDNICGFECDHPAFGIVATDPIYNNCPDFVNNTPFQICGSYILAANSTLDSLTLSVSTDNGHTFIPVTAPVTVTPNPLDSTKGTYCFAVDVSLFSNPMGNYIFQVSQNYTQTCALGTFHNTNTTLVVVNLANCCQVTLNTSMLINTPTHEERQQTIFATNKFTTGTTGNNTYHAGKYVELNQGFETQLNSRFAAWVEPCSGNITYKNQQQPSVGTVPNEIKSNLIKISKGFEIYPNPSSGSIEIAMSNTKFNKITIYALDGKMIFEKVVESTQKYQCDVSKYPQGIYIVTVFDDDGLKYSQKLIKN